MNDGGCPPDFGAFCATDAENDRGLAVRIVSELFLLI